MGKMVLDMRNYLDQSIANASKSTEQSITNASKSTEERIARMIGDAARASENALKVFTRARALQA